MLPGLSPGMIIVTPLYYASQWAAKDYAAPVRPLVLTSPPPGSPRRGTGMGDVRRAGSRLPPIASISQWDARRSAKAGAGHVPAGGVRVGFCFSASVSCVEFDLTREHFSPGQVLASPIVYDITLDDRERLDLRRDSIEIDKVIYDVHVEVLLNRLQDIPVICGENTSEFASSPKFLREIRVGNLRTPTPFKGLARGILISPFPPNTLNS